MADTEILFENQSYILKESIFNYECSDRGLILPIFNEFTWPKWLRALLYLIGLIYCFLGVAIIADIFMGAIEKITSKTRKIYLTNPDNNESDFIEVRVWSDAVANLTLMALGSSAPEILLSCIEVIGNNFQSKDLGPGTIVGSAAFNLFVISGVCVMAIPDGEFRRIKDIKVFGVTAIFSVIAYLWMWAMLVFFSPNVVEIWEAVVTLILFPILVITAWIAERNFCARGKKINTGKQIEVGEFQPDEYMKQRSSLRDGKLDKKGLISFIKEAKKYPRLSDDDIAVLAATRLQWGKSRSRLWYRVGAVRAMTGGRKTHPLPLSSSAKNVNSIMNPQHKGSSKEFLKQIEVEYSSMINFHSSHCAVLENIGKFQVEICRSGELNTQATVRIESIDGTAKVDTDYIGINELVTFEPGETSKKVWVEIVDDNQWEPDEEFYLKLSLPLDMEKRKNVKLGRISIMEINILDDDNPGTVGFQKRGFLVKESIGKVVIPVIRKDGSDGNVSVRWKTLDKTAVSEKDYIGADGLLEFKHTEVELSIEIEIMNNMSPEDEKYFEIILYDCEGGLKLGTINKTAVTITNDEDFNNVLTRMMSLTSQNLDEMKVHNDDYIGQIKSALSVNGGNIKDATTIDYFLHVLTFGWKVLFSLVPPPSIWGGWLCFFISLTCIGFLTAIIGDLAAIFGCLVGLKDSVTAITFVALGTSLPDTFASKTAAIQEKHADNAIGNITGSNSVNVFLGLGLPWLIAAIVNEKFRNSYFLVPAGDLGFSVGLFSGLCVASIALLLLRRYSAFAGGGELGGSRKFKYLSGVILIGFWLIYVLLSSLKAYHHF